MTSSSTFSSCWTSLRARSSAMLDRSRSSSIAPLAPGEGGMQTASYYAHFPSLWHPARAWTSSLEFLRGYRILFDVRDHAGVEYALAISDRIKATIEVEIGASQVQPHLFRYLLQRLQALWQQHHIGLIDGCHGDGR